MIKQFVPLPKGVLFQVIANQIVQEFPHHVAGQLRQARPAATFSRSPSKIKRGAPTLGEYSEEALRNLGYDEGLIKSLIRDGVVGVPDKKKYRKW